MRNCDQSINIAIVTIGVFFYPPRLLWFRRCNILEKLYSQYLRINMNMIAYDMQKNIPFINDDVHCSLPLLHFPFATPQILLVISLSIVGFQYYLVCFAWRCFNSSKIWNLNALHALFLIFEYFAQFLSLS